MGNRTGSATSARGTVASEERSAKLLMDSHNDALARLHKGDVLDSYDLWPPPVVIMSDGPYGLKNYPGDLTSVDRLQDWYAPHIAKWSERATAETTLWFWNTEVGWATVHPTLQAAGWQYRGCNTWDKGVAHIAGRANTRTLRRFPAVTEVCVQYVRKVEAESNDLQDWLRAEWKRSGLPLSMANTACGVKNAATRKYLTADALWYCPPDDAFDKMRANANEHGDPEGAPYFVLEAPLGSDQKTLQRIRAKFTCEYGVTNVWREPPVNGRERIKLDRGQVAHSNQKPVRLVDRCIRASSDEGDVVWEPFGGLCTVAVAAYRTGRVCYSAEIDEGFYALALDRLSREVVRTLRDSRTGLDHDGSNEALRDGYATASLTPPRQSGMIMGTNKLARRCY